MAIRCDGLGVSSEVTGKTLDIGEGGAQVLLNDPVPVRGVLQIRLLDWRQSLQTELTGRVIRSRLEENGKHRVSLRFDVPDDAIHHNLIRHTYTAPDTWEDFHKPVPAVRSLVRLLQSPLRWLRAKELPGRRIAPRFKIETPGVLLGPRGLIGIGAVCELSESGVAIRLPSKYHARMPYMTELRLRMTWPDSDEVIDVPVMIVRDTAGAKTGSTPDPSGRVYGLVFHNLLPDVLARIRQYIYQPRVISGQSLDVLEARQAVSLRQKQWLAQIRVTWGNVTPAHPDHVQVHCVRQVGHVGAERVLGGGDGVRERRVDDDDATPGGGVHIDVVHANAGTRDHLEPLPFDVEPGPTDLHRAHLIVLP